MVNYELPALYREFMTNSRVKSSNAPSKFCGRSPIPASVELREVATDTIAEIKIFPDSITV
ncbi:MULTISPECIES: hypothetical protein [Leptolyngbya]|uniref:hypothetical protein n=1 Tax=Leptolyngbya TaxID=47251 RepID=UPI0003649FA0|nr:MULTISPECIES: hypothetical protein [Leptolyngbya]MBD1858152.1 hypothetical protein [Leptolyngbya sp. FACHB-1624]MBD2367849.1 hypothetical protein [Leptolyngbya sp. FACHB-161]MBD2374303.1 hypothetical protein [Leptolyngbya sp. FACHB-238]MBD2398525.1 hypothetical protein [Leptolyngbya sp. FACHB-239]MBD2406227.1 hypothetical protein [Leptolyngbya sp. FACHB-402]